MDISITNATIGTPNAVIFGGICLGVGIWVKVDNTYLIYLTRISNDVTNLSALNLPSLIESAAWVLIAGGAGIFVVAFLGFCGAIKEIKCCLYLYVLLVFIILGVQIAAVALAVVYSTQFQSYAQTYLTASLSGKYVGPYDTSNAVSLAWDIAHIKLSCCGVDGPNDFSTFSTWNTTWVNPNTNALGTATIPATCCLSTSSASFPLQPTTFFNAVVDPACPVTKGSSQTVGCYNALKTLFSKYFYVIIGIGAAVVVCEVLGIVSACCIAKKKNEIESM
ncbi:tetraspanin-18-like [Gigantopelta aegis]|uniref:tetraspanin-18-like n=1 Tax=Gigantopelta aegis TaxID=1735272 RepID=UPI001B88C4EE|nr:tetraspanin-18-like [Gigantopelta aegis]